MSEYVDLAVKMVTGEWDFMMWVVAVLWGYFVYVFIYNVILGKGGRTEETPSEEIENSHEPYEPYYRSGAAWSHHPSNPYHTIDE